MPPHAKEFQRCEVRLICPASTPAPPPPARPACSYKTEVRAEDKEALRDLVKRQHHCECAPGHCVRRVERFSARCA